MDDLIRRGALEMVLLRETAWHDNSDEDVAYAAVQAAPSVDAVEVVHARWIEEPEHIPHCSRCGLYSDDADYGRANYCPGCGARMVAQTDQRPETEEEEKDG